VTGFVMRSMTLTLGENRASGGGRFEMGMTVEQICLRLGCSEDN
jgi:hypothetical protein